MIYVSYRMYVYFICTCHISSVHAARLNLVHELFCDMSAPKAKHQCRLLHGVALVISISIEICMIFGPT